MTAQQIITISQKRPISDVDQALEIAKVFHEQKQVYVPQGKFFEGFWRMISAIWHSGYIAGVQAERRKRHNTELEG